MLTYLTRTPANYSHTSWEYHTISETLSHPDCGTYTAYGLQVCRYCDGVQQILSTVSDISIEKAFVDHLAALFTKNQLSPIHLLDVLADMLP